jgi:hypothetical protein
VNVYQRARHQGVNVQTRSDPRLILGPALCVLVAALLSLGGCGPVRLVASASIPQPLVVKIPVAVALFMPQEFAQYIHKEERWGTDYNIEIGNAQANALSRLLESMFERVIVVDSLNAGTQLGTGAIGAILEPSVEEYAFVTPRDAGGPHFAVSIKYRVNVYSPDGKLADSWGFTGYGSAPAGGLSNTEPLEHATARAMRDAGAKLAVEFRDQAIVRGLLPEGESADDPVAAPASEETPAQESPAPESSAPESSSEGGAPPEVPEPEQPAAPSTEPPKEGEEEGGKEEEKEVAPLPDLEALA